MITQVRLTLLNGERNFETLNLDQETLDFPNESTAFRAARETVGKSWPIVRRRSFAGGKEYDATIFALVVTAEILP